MAKVVKRLYKITKKGKGSRKQNGGQMTTTLPVSTTSTGRATTTRRAIPTTTRQAITTTTRSATTTTQSGSTTSTMPPLTIYLTRDSDGNIEFPTSIPAGLTVTRTQLPNKSSPEINKITITGIDKPLKNVMIFGYSNTSWVSASAKLNSGSTSILMSDASGNPIRSSTARSQPGANSMIKLPLTSVVSTLNISGLEQGNFSKFAAGGDKLNGGSNIKIQLFF